MRVITIPMRPSNPSAELRDSGCGVHGFCGMIYFKEI